MIIFTISQILCLIFGICYITCLFFPCFSCLILPTICILIYTGFILPILIFASLIICCITTICPLFIPCFVILNMISCIHISILFSINCCFIMLIGPISIPVLFITINALILTCRIFIIASVIISCLNPEKISKVGGNIPSSIRNFKEKLWETRRGIY